VAISVTGDPTGEYFLYKVPAQDDPFGVRPGSVLPDYPKWSVWSDTYVLTTRDFGGNVIENNVTVATYFGVSVYAIEKEALISGSAFVQAKQFALGQQEYGCLIGDELHMLAADIDGDTFPPPGTPIPILSSEDDDFGGVNDDALNVWELSVDWDNSEVFFAFVRQLPVAEFSTNIAGPVREDVGLPGGTKVHTISVFLLHRLAYQRV